MPCRLVGPELALFFFTSGLLRLLLLLKFVLNTPYFIRLDLLRIFPSISLSPPSQSRRGVAREQTSVKLGDDQMQEFKAAFQMFTGGKEHLNAEALEKALKKFGAALPSSPPPPCPI